MDTETERQGSLKLRNSGGIMSLCINLKNNPAYIIVAVKNVCIHKEERYARKNEDL